MKSSNVVKASAAGIAFIASLGVAATARAAGPENTVRAGVIVNPVGTVATIEYERLFDSRFAAGVRVGNISYDWSDGSYDEDGDGQGIELIGSLYPHGEGFKGFYLAAALGYWKTDWTWTDPNDIPMAGNGESEAIDVNVSIGWKIPLGSPHVYLQPSFTIGNFFSNTTKSSTPDQDSELGVYAGVGLHVGGAF